MCTEIDYLPHLMMITEKDLIIANEFDRRKSWAPSTSSSSSSTTHNNPNNPTSWIERKLFSHFKRFFRRNSISSRSNSSVASSRRPSSTTAEEVLSIPTIELPSPTDEDEVEIPINEHSDPPSSIDEPQASSSSSSLSQTDLLYDYDQLLARCLKRQEHDRHAMISQCQTPITIPHADLILGHSRTILNNWKSYVRLFRALNRDPHLFQQYVNQYYTCQSSINQTEQLTFNIRTTKNTFDNLLKAFLNEYVTCYACQKAQTHLIKSTGLWRIDCQLCGSQRTVKRLRWKR